MLRILLILTRGLVLAAGGLVLLAGCKPADSTVTLRNVSYDPTRELYKEYNEAFKQHWKELAGQDVAIEMVHGGSGKQARAVIEGLEASVLTLALAYDIDAVAERAGLLAADWQGRLPNRSCPYTSTIVFLVRKGNPKAIHNWDDLLGPGVTVITPDPKTSGGARWNYLAAWGYVLQRELGDLKKVRDPAHAEAAARAQDKARQFITDLYHHVPQLDSGARDATMTFARRNKGDVLLAWENDAFFAIREFAADQFEMVVPSVSILAEPPVAVVDELVDKQGTRAVAEEYLRYLYSPEGQTIIAKNFYRPFDRKGVPEEYLKQFCELKLFSVDDVFGGWHEAQKTHFADGGTFDEVYATKKQ
jgi:sulfate/thiosulfate transport system substrate-binding protein